MGLLYSLSCHREAWILHRARVLFVDVLLPELFLRMLSFNVNPFRRNRQCKISLFRGQVDTHRTSSWQRGLSPGAELHVRCTAVHCKRVFFASCFRCCVDEVRYDTSRDGTRIIRQFVSLQVDELRLLFKLVT